MRALRTLVATTTTLRLFLTGVGLAAGLGACSLSPIRAHYHVQLSPQEDKESYQVDSSDSSAIFSLEGLRLKVRHLGDTELDSQYPDPENPFTYRGEVDPDLGYVPPRFTVFQLALDNPTFDKVLLQPHKVVLVTDRGLVMPPYQLSRAESKGDPRNFETYWLSRGVQSGNQQKLYLERMGTLRGAVYHRDAFVFKGNAYSGKLVFDPLPPGTRSVTLQVENFVLEFGIYDVPKNQMDIAFQFGVESAIIEPDGLADVSAEGHTRQ
jgi:hypothetical protein